MVSPLSEGMGNRDATANEGMHEQRGSISCRAGASESALAKAFSSRVNRQRTSGFNKFLWHEGNLCGVTNYVRYSKTDYNTESMFTRKRLSYGSRYPAWPDLLYTEPPRVLLLNCRVYGYQAGSGVQANTELDWHLARDNPVREGRIKHV